MESFTTPQKDLTGLQDLLGLNILTATPIGLIKFPKRLRVAKEISPDPPIESPPDFQTISNFLSDFESLRKYHQTLRLKAPPTFKRLAIS